MSKIKKFILISADEIAIAIVILTFTYILAREWFQLVAIITIIGMAIFLILKWMLVSPVLGEEKVSYDVQGKTGIALENFEREGIVMIEGGRWKAVNIGKKSIKKSDRVRIVRRKGLVVYVTSVDEEEV